MIAVISGSTVLGHPNVELHELLKKKKQISVCPLLVKPSTSSGKKQPSS